MSEVHQRDNLFSRPLISWIKSIQSGVPITGWGPAVWEWGSDSNLHQKEMIKERILTSTVQIYASKSQMAKLIKLRSN